MSLALAFPGILGLPIFLPVFGICSTILIVIPICLILQKAGYSPWLGLFALIPLAAVIILWVLAFTDWPSQKTVASGTGPSGPSQGS